MLSYQHSYHAGNHADILKHIILAETISYMKNKDKPMVFFDTHGGSGLYQIDSDMAQKTGEINTGILKLLKSPESVWKQNDSIKSYIELIQPYIQKGEYPGSPFIEADLLRNIDQMHVSELHPVENQNLVSNFEKRHSEIKSGCKDICKANCKVIIEKSDGFKMLESHTPPFTKRGAVLIDPSYEETEDYEKVSDTVLKVFKRWNGGVFLIWYPLLNYRMSVIENMVERITEGVHIISPNTDVNDFRMCVRDPEEHEETSLSENSSPRLYGSGMLVINTPWTLPDKMKEALPILEELLKCGC